jgi:hypothetical protein
MRRLVILLLLLAGTVMLVSDYGHAGSTNLRCGTRLASVGMRQGEVVAICGEPASTRSWQETLESGTGSQKKGYFTASITVNYEEWMYNFGSTRFIQYLLFKNGILVNIESGGYGY